MNNSFYKNKKVFITGHTGFKGSWLSKILLMLGADVYGYSLKATEEQKLFSLSGAENEVVNFYEDIRDLDRLKSCMRDINPDIVFHLAAQPLVRESYNDPINTYSTNVMGTVHLLEAVRGCSNTRSVVNVTTDKVYLNRESNEAYKEDDVLNGHDPYSNSKSCSELVTSSYKKSFFKDSDAAVSTCRAGNVIGGGDFSVDRIIPDCYRAVSKGEVIAIRNPNSVRPYQHVLEPLFVYLMIAQKQFFEKEKYEGSYNIGPDEDSNVTTGTLVDLFCNEWKNNVKWESRQEINAVHEAKLLYLNCDKIKKTLQWYPVWNIQKAVEKTVEWYLCYYNHGDIKLCMERQISEYLKEAKYEI